MTTSVRNLLSGWFDKYFIVTGPPSEGQMEYMIGMADVCAVALGIDDKTAAAVVIAIQLEKLSSTISFLFSPGLQTLNVEAPQLPAPFAVDSVAEYYGLSTDELKRHVSGIGVTNKTVN